MGFLSSLAGNLTGGIVGDSEGEAASSRGRKLSRKMTKKVIKELEDSFGLSEADLSPYLQYGEQALGELWDQRKNDPNAPSLEIFDFDSSQVGESDAYKWRYEQGQNAAERSLASNRNLNSGERLMAMQRYGQGAASQEYEAEFRRQAQSNTLRNAARQTQYGMDSDRFRTQMDRLSGIGIGGQNAASGLASMRMNKAGSVANAYTGNAANQFSASLIPVQEKMNFVSGLMGAGGQYLGGK